MDQIADLGLVGTDQARRWRSMVGRARKWHLGRAPGTNPAAVDVALAPRSATISGTVTADGNPLSGATVTLDPGAGTGPALWSFPDTRHP